jgi:hypothetical protein
VVAAAGVKLLRINMQNPSNKLSLVLKAGAAATLVRSKSIGGKLGWKRPTFYTPRGQNGAALPGKFVLVLLLN